MLTLVTLVVCSAASVASAMPNGIMSSGNVSSPWNVTHAPIAGSSAVMSSYTDNAEERAIDVPERFDSVLGRMSKSTKGLPTEEKDVKKLAALIEAINDKCVSITENRDIFDSPSFPAWNKLVMTQYKDDKVAARKAMIAMLKPYYQGDELALVLVAGAKHYESNKRGAAGKMIDVLIREWVDSRRSAKEIFKLLRLDQASNIFTDELFVKWRAFLTVRYVGDEVYNKALPVLVEQFKGDDVALCKYLVAIMEVKTVRGIATGLLTLQLKTWGEAQTKDPDWVFDLLKLYNTENKAFNKALFPSWVAYVKSKSENDLNNPDATEAMFSTMNKVCKDDLGKVLNEVAMIDGMITISKKIRNVWNQGLPNVPKPQNVELGEPSSQKRQKVGSNKRQAEIDVEPARLERQKDNGKKTVAKTLQAARNEGLSIAPKRHNVELGEPSSQKRQKVDSNKRQAEIDVEPSGSKRQKVGSNKPPAKTDGNEPSAKTDVSELPAEVVEPSRLKRQKSFDLNEQPPKTEINLNLPPRED